MTTTFTTANDAKAAIVDAIEAGDAQAGDYDVDAIFDATYEWDVAGQRFVQTAEVAEFWAAVEANAR